MINFTKMKKIYVIICLLLVVMSSFGQKEYISIQDKIDSLIKSKKIPGIIAATSQKNKRDFYTSGFANKATEDVFNLETQLEIGSITKTFTAYILTSILNEKNIDVNTSIGAFLPDSVRINTTVSGITFLQLMNHTSGLPRLPSNMDMGKNQMQPYINYSLKNLYSYLTKAMPDTNKKVSYSNLGMGLAGVLAENISNNSYEQLLKKYITAPFKMKSTGLNSKENLPIAVGYFNGNAAEYWDMNALKAAGGVKSNTTDMLTYLEYILKHPGNKILESVSTVSAAVNDRIKVAKGWHILKETRNADITWHNGGTYGFSTFCAFNKTNGTAVFVAINAFNMNAISDGLGIEIMKMMALEK
jgi:CubicO group peptidase (beta-lactamase class C family)